MRLTRTLLVLSLVSIVAACGGGSSKKSTSSSAAAPDTVTIKSFTFSPNPTARDSI